MGRLGWVLLGGDESISWSSHLSHHIQIIVPSYICHSPYETLSQQPGSQGVLVLGHGHCRAPYLYMPLYVLCVYITQFIPKCEMFLNLQSCCKDLQVLIVLD